MKEIFEKAFDGSYYTILGCGGDLNDWKNGYEKLLKEEGICSTPRKWIQFVGKDLNTVFGLTGNNAYPDDLTCLMFPIDDITETGKLAMFKFRMQDRWFDDLVSNDLRREGKSIEEIF